MQIGREIASALDVVHSIGVIHRDLKPANVMLVEQGGTEHAKVVDFGLARLMEGRGYEKLTRTGQVVGTPAYMAPEQLFGGRMDERTDVYALGALLYTALAGGRPYSGEPAELLAKVLAGEHRSLREVAPLVPPRLAEIVERAMSPEAADRFATMGELADALSSLASGPLSSLVGWKPAVPIETLRQRAERLEQPRDEPPPESPVTVVSSPPRPSRRVLLLAGFAAALLGALVVGAVLFFAGPKGASVVAVSDGPVLPAVTPVSVVEDAAIQPQDASPPDATDDGEKRRGAASSEAPEVARVHRRQPPPSSAPQHHDAGSASRIRISIVHMERDEALSEASIRRGFARQRGAIERCLAGLSSLPPRPLEAEVSLGVAENGAVPGFGGHFPNGAHGCFSSLQDERYSRRPSPRPTATVRITISIEDAGE